LRSEISSRALATFENKEKTRKLGLPDYWYFTGKKTRKLGLPDYRYFTSLAGILLLILQWPVKGQYFENQGLKSVFFK